MDKKADLIAYLDQGIARLNAEFPQNAQSTTMLFQLIFGFLDTDFEEMTDNRIYRHFLASFKELIYFAFESGVSKSYLRCLFKYLDNNAFVDYLGNYAKVKTSSIQSVMDLLVNAFTTSWQGCNNDRKSVLEHIIQRFDCWMKL